MSQSTDLTISNQLMANARSEMNDIFAALGSMHLESTDPSYILQGMIWGNSNGTPWLYKVYDGTDKITWMEVYPSTNNVNFVSIKGGDARDEAANIGQIQDGGFHRIGSIAGTNTITGDLSPAIAEYASGQRFSLIVGTTNSGAVTLNINGLGAKAVQKNGLPLAAGDFTAGDVVQVEYDGTQFQMLTPARTPVLLNGAIIAAKNMSNTFSGAQIAGETTLTSTTNSIAVDLSLNNDFAHTFSEDTTLANPSNAAAGQSGAIRFTQHASDPKTLAFGSSWKFPGGTAPTVTASNGAFDTLHYYVRSASVIECNLVKGYA